MYSGVNALGGPKSWEGIGASLYFILLVILGNCILDHTSIYLHVNIIFGTLTCKGAFWLLFLCVCVCVCVWGGGGWGGGCGRAGDDVDLRFEKETN